jgi:ureidoacrylate peracid hydrolase
MHKIEIDPAVATRRPLDWSDLDPRKTALLVIDMQAFFIDWPGGMANPYAAAIIDNTNRLTAAMRAAGGKVVFTQHASHDEAPWRVPGWQEKGSAVLKALNTRLRPGNPEFAVHEALKVEPGDAMIVKYRPSAFHPLSYVEEANSLQTFLRAAGVDTLVITGTLTNGCCESTARDAWQHGYKLLFVEDANAALTDAEHNATLTSMAGFFAHVLSTQRLVEILGRGPTTPA